MAEDDPASIDDWMDRGKIDPSTVDSEWSPRLAPGIDGVRVKEIRPVLTGDGILTEIWRQDWNFDDLPVRQVFQRLLDPGTVNGWHAHVETSDRLFCAFGRIRLSLYDGRRPSPTYDASWETIIGAERPGLVFVPPGVWHAVSVLGDKPALLVNAVDKAYDYDRPDHRRLPLDTPHIPLKLC